MISIEIACKVCTFRVTGRTPAIAGQGFDEAVRQANGHAEREQHELQILRGFITPSEPVR